MRRPLLSPLPGSSDLVPPRNQAAGGRGGLRARREPGLRGRPGNRRTRVLLSTVLRRARAKGRRLRRARREPEGAARAQSVREAIAATTALTGEVRILAQQGYVRAEAGRAPSSARSPTTSSFVEGPSSWARTRTVHCSTTSAFGPPRSSPRTWTSRRARSCRDERGRAPSRRCLRRVHGFADGGPGPGSQRSHDVVQGAGPQSPSRRPARAGPSTGHDDPTVQAAGWRGRLSRTSATCWTRQSRASSSSGRASFRSAFRAASDSPGTRCSCRNRDRRRARREPRTSCRPACSSRRSQRTRPGR